ncbi:MAG: hypothetical protein AB7O48_16445 [Cyclobacteriaceae bacterium]
MALKAVITGDIINSTHLDRNKQEALFKLISLTLKRLGNIYSMRSEMYRGDSFQCLVHKPEDALRIALLIKTAIRSWNPAEEKKPASRKKKTKVSNTPAEMFDARMAIGIAEMENSRGKLASNTEMPFILSGHKLDELKNSKQTLAIDAMDEFGDELDTESILLDTILSKTTALQCEVINMKLDDYSEIEIAKKLKIGQSAVNHRSNLGSWNAIDAMVDRFETIYGGK